MSHFQILGVGSTDEFIALNELSPDVTSLLNNVFSRLFNLDNIYIIFEITYPTCPLPINKKKPLFHIPPKERKCTFDGFGSYN